MLILREMHRYSSNILKKDDIETMTNHFNLSKDKFESEIRRFVTKLPVTNLL